MLDEITVSPLDVRMPRPTTTGDDAAASAAAAAAAAAAACAALPRPRPRPPPLALRAAACWAASAFLAAVLVVPRGEGAKPMEDSEGDTGGVLSDSF